MNSFENKFQLTIGNSLTYGQLREIKHTMDSGGVCIIPSDTCYSVAGLPFNYGTIESISNFIPDIKFKEIPLSFANISMLKQWVTLTDKDCRVIDEELPGPATLICKIKDEKKKPVIERILHTKGTIGVRIPDSPIERQLSDFLNSPITTCAIRSDNGLIIQNTDEVIDIVKRRVDNIDLKQRVLLVRSADFKYKNNSTIVTFQDDRRYNKLVVIREGEIPAEKIKRGSENYYSQWDIEDYT